MKKINNKDLYKEVLLTGSDYQKSVLEAWSIFGCKKIVLKLKSENQQTADEAFIELLANFQANNIMACSNKEKTVLAAGPDLSERLDKITGHLKLMS